MVSNPYQQYRSVAVETAQPAQLIVMLYDGAIRFNLAAQEALQNGDLAALSEKIGRVQAILEELIGTLNLEAGGEIAQNLYRVYEYMNYRLIQGQIKRDQEQLVEVERLLRDLRGAWAEIARTTPVANSQVPAGRA